MKLFTLACTFLPLLALANPVAEPEAEAEAEAAIEKRAKTCTLTGCDIRYHTSRDASSPAPGQISGCNQKVSFSCYQSGKSVNGDPYWDKIASGQGAGYWITEYYVDSNCAVGLPPC